MLVALDISGSMQQRNFSMDHRSRFETVRELLESSFLEEPVTESG